jgi:glycosyltransferase involved in cell wall biosynthesis
MVTGEGKAALLAQASFLVLPSYSEGFPVAVAEALGYGRPVVITNTCYVSGVAEEGAGLVVPPEGRALRDALREMMGDPALRQSCSQQAMQVARTHYSWETVAQQSLAFYREAINSKK